MIYQILSLQIVTISIQMICLGLFVSCMTSQTAYSLRTIYPERKDQPGHLWYNDADWFNLTVPRNSSQDIQTLCAKYDGKKCNPNLKCMCKCNLSKATLSLYRDEWRCTNYTEVRRRALCRYKFNRELDNQQIVYLPTGSDEKAYFNEPQHSSTCTIDVSSSRYLTCNGIWSPITVIGSVNTTLQLVHHVYNLYDVKVQLEPKFPNLNGRLIKLVLNCNKTSDGEPCLLFKLRGFTDCHVTSEAKAQSCDLTSSIPVWHSLSTTSSLPSSTLNEFQSSYLSYPWSVSSHVSTAKSQTHMLTASIGTKQVTTSTVLPTKRKQESNSVGDVIVITAVASASGLLFITTSAVSPTKSGSDNKKQGNGNDSDVTVIAAAASASGLLFITTSAVSPTKSGSDNKKQENGSNSDVTVIVAASSAGGLLFMIFICTIIIVFCRRKRRNNNRGKRVLLECQDQVLKTNEYSLQNMSAYEDVDCALEGEQPLQLSAENPLQTVQIENNANSAKELLAENPMYEDFAAKQLSEQIQSDASLYDNTEAYVQMPARKSYDSKDEGSKDKTGSLSVPTKNVLPVYACVDMEKKRKETQQIKGSKQRLCDSDAKDKEYAEPEVPIRLYGDNDSTQTKDNSTRDTHYEQVGDTMNSSNIRDGLESNVPLGAPQSSEYDKPEGIILNDGRSIPLPDELAEELRLSVDPADHNTAGTQSHEGKAGGEEPKATAPEPVYDEAGARDQLPVFPTRRPEIPGYDIPEGIVLEDGGCMLLPDGFAPFNVM